MRFKPLLLCFLVMINIVLCSCEPVDYTPSTPSYTEEHFVVDAVVTKYNVDHWYAGYQHHYRMRAEVYCKEYNLSKTFEETVSGMWINSPLWELEEGQTVKVIVYKRQYEDHSQTWIERISS